MLGEKASLLFLVKHGFKIVARNYRKKYGEIDIVAQKGEKMYFIEVKAVSCEILISGGKSSVNKNLLPFRVEENVHAKKLRSLFKTIQVYLSEKQIPENMEWQLDLHVVYLDVLKKRAKVDVLENITH